MQVWRETPWLASSSRGILVITAPSPEKLGREPNLFAITGRILPLKEFAR